MCGNWFGTKNGAQTLVGGFLQEIRAESRLICYCTSWQRTPILVGATPAEAVYEAKAQDGGIGKVFPKLRFVYTKAIQLHKVCVNAPPRYWSGRCHNHHSSEIRGFCLMKWIFFEHKNQHIQSIFPPLINASTSRNAKNLSTWVLYSKIMVVEAFTFLISEKGYTYLGKVILISHEDSVKDGFNLCCQFKKNFF